MAPPPSAPTVGPQICATTSTPRQRRPTRRNAVMSRRRVLVAATPTDAGRDALALGVKLARPVGAEIVLGGVVTAHGASLGARADALREQLETLRGAGPHDVPIAVEIVSATSVLRG